MDLETGTNKTRNQTKNSILSFKVENDALLLDFLILSVRNKSRNNVKSLLRNGMVSVDGTVITRHDHLLKEGQEVLIVKSTTVRKQMDKHPMIVYEDDELVVINKPTGLVSVSTDTEKNNTAYKTINDYMRSISKNNSIFVVHRLDRDTSGILIFAKTEKLKLALQNNWSELVIDRAYIAVVEGRVDEKKGTIHSWLKQTKTLLMYSSAKSGEGLEAITNYSVLKENDNYSLFDIHIETGRKNQIRVHMKDLGHSIAGDKKYGAKTNPLNRLCLHAYKLELIHPFTKKIMRFEAPEPACFKKLFAGENKLSLD